MANNFTYMKCWGIGQRFPTLWKGTWAELMLSNEWREFREKHELTTNQIFYLKRGFDQLPFEEPKVVEESYDNHIMPFGKFKGRPFKELSNNYLKWFMDQDWKEKWAELFLYAKTRLKENEENKMSKEEIQKALSLDNEDE